MTARHSLDQIVRGLDGVTAGNAFPTQNYNCPCLHPSQCDNSCFQETREIIGFQWDIPFPASPEQGEKTHV